MSTTDRLFLHHGNVCSWATERYESELEKIVFATGFDHPLDVIDDHRSGLLVEDYGSGAIYDVSYASGSSTQPNTTTASTGGSSVALPSTLESFPFEFLILIAAFGVLVVLAWRKNRKQQ